jgi:putative ABC transport system substrate-binding protein
MDGLGWIEGRTIAIGYRWDGGRPERSAEIAAEFVRLKVDVIVTGSSAVLALKRETSTIPIVFTMSSDPVGAGLVAIRARPGGTLTGLSLQQSDLAGKRLELLREVIPKLRRLAILANVGYPEPVLETKEVQTAAGKLGFEVTLLEIQRAEKIAPAFESLKGQADALYVVVDALVGGTKPGDIPVEQPTKFDLVINLTTAKAIGLTIPDSLLLRADKVIE